MQSSSVKNQWSRKKKVLKAKWSSWYNFIQKTWGLLSFLISHFRLNLINKYLISHFSNSRTKKDIIIFGHNFVIPAIVEEKSSMGSFTNYVDNILAFFLTTYPPALTFSMVWKLTKSFLRPPTYLPRLVNVVCERPLCKKNLLVSSSIETQIRYLTL